MFIQLTLDESLLCASAVLGLGALTVSRTDHGHSLPFWKETDKKGKPFWEVTGEKVQGDGVYFP